MFVIFRHLTEYHKYYKIKHLQKRIFDNNFAPVNNKTLKTRTKTMMQSPKISIWMPTT